MLWARRVEEAGGQVNRQDVDKQGRFRFSRTPTNKKSWQVAGGRWQVVGSVCMMAAGQRYRTCTGKGGSSRTSYLMEGML